MKKFFKENLSFFVYAFFCIFIELLSLYLITNSIIIERPWLGICSLGILFSIYLFIKSPKWKKWLLFISLFIHTAICLTCVILYDNTGTFFDFNMFKLFNEAFVASNNLDINLWYLIFIIFLFIIATILFDYLSKKNINNLFSKKISNIIASIMLSICLIGHSSIIVLSNKVTEENFYKRLYINYGDSYSMYGQSTAFINELYKMLFFNNYENLTENQIEEFIYKSNSSPSQNFAVSEGNNLVTIMVESFEWFAFISDTSVYPNGLNIDDSILDNLFPNLRKFYNMSTIMNNHYSRNKTDMSELESILGALPNSKYISYTFSKNDMLYSLANNFKILDNDIVTSFFHNNNSDFYDRENTIPSLGFDKYYFIEDMVDYGVKEYITTDFVNLNSDSDMIEHMKDFMFFEDKRFYTHITTLSMHGSYIEREVFSSYKQKLNDLGVTIDDDNLRNYITAVMDFDYGLGLILEDLEKKNLMNNTTIVIYADHNTYMDDLSYQVKNIYDQFHDNFLELFRVPLMIYDPGISHQIIDKFTTTYDIVPTILDMFGIRYFDNLYYGNNIFLNEKSILYSMAYNIFITEDLYFYNIKDIIYNNKSIVDENIKIVEQQCLDLLTKIYYTNHIFEYDFFSKKSNHKTYINNFTNINNS